MTADLSPRQAIDLFRAQRLSGAHLLRIFAAYEQWIVPGRLADERPTFHIVQSAQNDRRLLIFSDADAWQAARDQLGTAVLGEQAVTLAGDAVFAGITDDVDSVKVNPFGANDLFYTRDQFPRLRQWAQIAAVERALANVLRTGGGLDTIRNFDGYYIAVNRTGLQSVALVPDDKGRRLAAVFTALDALEAYLDEYGGPDTQPLGMTGEQLFAALRRMPLDGIVFNPEGPAVFGFSIAFVALVLRTSAPDSNALPDGFIVT
jgi:hypothetical protein